MYKRTNELFARVLVLIFRNIQCMFYCIQELCSNLAKRLMGKDQYLTTKETPPENKREALKKISIILTYLPVLVEDILTGAYILNHLIEYGSSLRHHQKRGHYYERTSASLVAIELILIGPSVMWMFTVFLNIMEFRGILEKFPKLITINEHFFNINTVAVLSFLIQTPYLYLNNIYYAGQDSTTHFITSLGHFDDDGGYFSDHFPAVNALMNYLGIVLAVLFMFELSSSITQVNWYSLVIFQSLFLFVMYSSFVQQSEMVGFVNLLLFIISFTVMSALVCFYGLFDTRVPCFTFLTVLRSFVCEVLLVTVYPYLVCMALPYCWYKEVDYWVLLDPLLINPSTRLSLLYEEKGYHLCCCCCKWCDKDEDEKKEMKGDIDSIPNLQVNPMMEMKTRIDNIDELKGEYIEVEKKREEGEMEREEV